MFRILLSYLALFVFHVEVSAQATPTGSPSKASSTRAKVPAQSSQASHATATDSGYIASDGVRDSAGLIIQNVYAAPGAPVIIKDGKVGPYDGKAAELKKRKKTSTTLSPKRQN
jgi:hypothetical protein